MKSEKFHIPTLRDKSSTSKRVNIEDNNFYRPEKLGVKKKKGKSEKNGRVGLNIYGGI